MSDNKQGGPRGGGKGGFGKGRGGPGGGSRGGKPFRPRAPGGEGGGGEGGERKTFRPRGDRPDGGGKPPFAKREGGFRARREGEGGESRPRGERPEGGKPFRPREEGGEGRSFRPRGEGRPEADRPFRARPDGGGEGRSFRPRGEGRPEGERPFRPREGGADGAAKPFRPRGEGRPAGGGKPFRPREERSEGERPARAGFSPFAKREGGFRARREDGDARPRGERPEGGKPFRPREERGGEERRPTRPRGEDGGGERTERPFRARREEGEGKPFVPRSRGMASHGGARAGGEGAERPRSYGRLQHEAGGDERRPRALGERPRRDRDEGATRPRVPREAVAEGEADGRMRIAKRLARAGIASRRDAEGMIADGRVTLNGKLLDSPAVDVTMSDRIEIDGKPLPAIERTRLWLFHKPPGTVTTNHDPEGRPTVFDRLPEEMPRVLSIGRLDINTEGLLLLTNDGGLARVLELPATGWLRRYRVRAHGEITQEKLDELRQGIAVEGVFYGAIEATLDRTQGSNVWLTVGLREGKNREVKRVLGALGLEVNRLIRLSFGPFQLGELGEGEVQEINGRTLRDQLGPKLIEESGADFDAPILNPFSNKPVAAAPAERRAEEGEEEGRPARRPREREKPTSEWVTASGAEKPNRKRFGAAKREDALGRLDTRAPREGGRGFKEGRGDRPPFEKRERPAFDGAKPFRAKPFGAAKREGEGEERGPRRPPANAPRRSANVWMAPGARAAGEKKRAAREERDREGGARPFRPRPPGGAGGEGPRRGPPSGGAPRRPRRED